MDKHSSSFCHSLITYKELKFANIEKQCQSGMGKIGKVDDLDLEKYHIRIHFWDLDLNKYRICLLKISPF
jgi:hypothetical protein